MSIPWQAAGTFDADGKSLEYACVGPAPGKAPTIVLLHEGLGCARLWRDFPENLSKACGFGVFVYSRAGYGQSDPAPLPRPLDYMTREATEVLPVVLDAIGAQQIVLLGHSDGATIAAIHAGRIVDTRVIGVALMAPHFFTESAGLKEIARARDAFDTGNLREKMGKYHRDANNAFRGWNDSWLHPDFISWNVTDVLDDIVVPVLAIQGRDDPYGTLAQIDIVVQRARKAAVSTLIIEECLHAPHLEHESTVISAISEFFEKSEIAGPANAPTR